MELFAATLIFILALNPIPVLIQASKVVSLRISINLCLPLLCRKVHEAFLPDPQEPFEFLTLAAHKKASQAVHGESYHRQFALWRSIDNRRGDHFLFKKKYILYKIIRDIMEVKYYN